MQRQLGQTWIKLKMDIYGKWLPTGIKVAVDKLDEESGSKMVSFWPRQVQEGGLPQNRPFFRTTWWEVFEHSNAPANVSGGESPGVSR